MDRTTVNNQIQNEKQNRITALHSRFEGALKFLKKPLLDKQGKKQNLKNLPWYLIIGPSGAGKTALLSHAEVHYILAKQTKPNPKKTQTNVKSCDWWVTADAVFLDIPGGYISSHDSAALGTQLWENLLTLLKKNQRQCAPQGVIIALNLVELVKKTPEEQEKHIHDVSQTIAQLRKKFGKNLPFYLVVTKCDLVAGFSEFFYDAGQEELTQAWGITLLPKHEREDFLGKFQQRFNALIKRLNRQLLWRLHHEKNLYSRGLIKDFPLQIEQLKEIIAQYLQKLAIAEQDINLHGVYLTSATQHRDEKINPYFSEADQALAQQNHALTAPPSVATPTRTHFIRQLLTQVIAIPSRPQNEYDFTWLKRVGYTTCAASVLLIAGVLGNDFQTSVQQMNSIQYAVTQYQIAIQQSGSAIDPQKVLLLLDTLQKATTAQHHVLGLPINIFSFYTQKTQQVATVAYQQALQEIILPEIKMYLTKNLIASANNPTAFYQAFQAYLMLGDAKHFSPDYVLQVLQKSLPSNAKPLFGHMQTALTTSYQARPLNSSLIAEARKKLAAIPALGLGYLILQNTGNNHQSTSLDFGMSQNAVIRVPQMFTAAALPKIFNQDIPQAVLETLQGNWILGTSSLNIQTAAAQALTDKLRETYLNNYVNVWENLLGNMNLSTAKDFTEMNTTLGELISEHSPLVKFLKTVQANTATPLILERSQNLQALNNLLPSKQNPQAAALYQVFNNLHLVQNHLQAIAHSNDIQKSSYDIAALRLKNNGQGNDPITQLLNTAMQSPAPLRNWLSMIAVNSWNLILQQASHYIESSWQKSIMTVYNTSLANRYPLNNTSGQDVNFLQFASFYGAEGELQNFIINTLQPFIDTSALDWQWRHLNGQTVTFSNSSLQSLQRIALLQKIFFPNGNNQMDIQFTLKPLQAPPGVRDFALDLNGQQINKQRYAKAQFFSWPGIGTQQQVSLRITDTNNKQLQTTIGGVWALNKLIDKANTKVIDPHHMILSFNLGGHQARYLLTANGSLDPFFSQNHEQLQLPEKL